MRQIRCIDVITSIIRADFLWSAPSSENNSTIRQLLLLFKDFSVQLPFSGSCLSKPHLHWLAMRSFWCHQPQSTRPTPSQHTDHHPLVNMASWFSSKCRKLHFTCLPVVYWLMLSNTFIDFLRWTSIVVHVVKVPSVHLQHENMILIFQRSLIAMLRYLQPMLYQNIIVTDKWQSQKWGKISQRRHYQQKKTNQFNVWVLLLSNAVWNGYLIKLASIVYIWYLFGHLGFWKLKVPQFLLAHMGELHQQSDLGKYGWTLRVQYILTIFLHKSEFLFVCFAADQSLFFHRTALADVARAESSQLLGGSRSRLATSPSRRFYCVATLQSVCHSR